MTGYSGDVLLGLGAALPAGMLLGGFVHAWWLRRQAGKRRRIPRDWPLTPRVLANSEERRVWRWLAGAFSDQHIMIKIPVTRFTLPFSKEQGLRWYELLSGLYCTFTVCGSDGHVFGCVDVAGRLGLARKTVTLKQALLSQCGVAYYVVAPDDLPNLTDIRTEFLGELASRGQDSGTDDELIAAARASLQASLIQKRQARDRDLWSGPSRGGRYTSGAREESSGFPPLAPGDLRQANSFLVPLDSRKGNLR